ncbi:MAG: GAF domain-containing protein [Paraglaciecola sp.]|nr:GAF domain-containing protein [Paraglaciecola sp.]
MITCLSDVLLNTLEISDFELYHLDASLDVLHLSTAFVVKKACQVEHSKTHNSALITKVANTLRNQVVDNFNLHPEFVAHHATQLSALVVPLIAEKNVRGVLYCGGRVLSACPLFVPQAVYEIASITATKFVMVRANQQLLQSVEQLEYSGKIQDTLFEIAELTFETSVMHEFYQRLHTCIAKLMFAANFFVGLVIDDGKAITLPYAVDEADDVPPDEIIPIDPTKPSITGYVLNTNQPLLASREKCRP